jgi:hypothetical protein
VGEADLGLVALASELEGDFGAVPLGWVLVAGGAGYVASAFVGYLAPDAGVVADALTAPASIGEFWMIGYLLIRGVNRRTLDSR